MRRTASDASELRRLCRNDPATAMVLITSALAEVGGHRRKAALSLMAAGMLLPREPTLEHRAYEDLWRCVRALPGMAGVIEARWPGSAKGGRPKKTIDVSESAE